MIEFVKEHWIILTALYVCGMVINGTRLDAKWGSDGPDGLIPIWGAVLWPINLAFNIIVMPFRILVWIGELLAGGRRKK